MARPPANETPQVSVIVLVYNEVDSIEPLHRELIGVLAGMQRSFEVLYIDDGSSDGSGERIGGLAAHDARVRLVTFRRNFGQTAAVQAGIDHSLGEVLVFMDGDMQNDPHDIPRLLDKIDEGFDVVGGWRRDRQDDAWRVIPSRVVNWLIARVTGVRLSDFGGTLKAYRRGAVADVRMHGEMRRLIAVLAASSGARITEVPVNHRPRVYGRSKRSFVRDSRVAIDLITVQVLRGPAREPVYVFGFAGLASWAVGLILAVVVLIQRATPAHVSVHTNPLFFVALALFVVGVQLLSIGVVSELAIRLHLEAPPRPAYLVREAVGNADDGQPATNGRAAVQAR